VPIKSVVAPVIVKYHLESRPLGPPDDDYNDPSNTSLFESPRGCAAGRTSGQYIVYEKHRAAAEPRMVPNTKSAVHYFMSLGWSHRSQLAGRQDPSQRLTDRQTEVSSQTPSERIRLVVTALQFPPPV
jgi:hypothetical protein